MIIATSITSSYLERSQPFFQSINEHMPEIGKDGAPIRKLCFTIGFATTIDGWECIETEQPECEWKPTNRPDYASLQHGEFVKYLPEDVEPDEMLLFCDSDMVLQRPFDLEFPSMRGVMVTNCSWPAQSLRQVVRNLNGKNVVRSFDIRKQYNEFCACFMIATVARWEDIYRATRGVYPLLDGFKHHAAWQLLINLAILRNFRAFLLPPHICNATWYTGTGMMEDGNIIVDWGGSMKAEKVYFRHTKFEAS